MSFNVFMVTLLLKNNFNKICKKY